MSKSPLYLFLAVAILLACADKSDDEFTQEISISYNQAQTFNYNTSSFTIQFADVLEESRCPDYAYCVWAGRVVIELIIDESHFTLGTGDLTTGTDTQINESISFEGINISIKSLNHPENGIDNKKDYSLILQLSN